MCILSIFQLRERVGIEKFYEQLLIEDSILNIHTKSVADATQVMITPYIEGYEDQTKRWHVCYSKGVLEKRIFDSIERKLGK